MPSDSTDILNNTSNTKDNSSTNDGSNANDKSNTNNDASASDKSNTAKEPRGKEVLMIPIDNIRMSPYQPRRNFNRAALGDLANSIKEYGVLQPICVREIRENTYELIVGERRVRASLLAGKTEIPAIVFAMSDNESAILAMVENLHRENLDYMDEASGYFYLLSEHGLTQEELARKMGRSQSTIANKIRLLKLSPLVSKIIFEYNLTERHARALLRTRDEKLQLQALKTICDKGLSVQESEDLIKTLIKENFEAKADKPFGRSEYAEKKDHSNSVKSAIKDVKVFVNTIRETIVMMKKAGVVSKAAQFDRGEYYEFIIRVYKKENGLK